MGMFGNQTLPMGWVCSGAYWRKPESNCCGHRPLCTGMELAWSTGWILRAPPSITTGTSSKAR
eukprot:2375262-Karenia_brevis.AAC.1